jgi:diaminopimelate epimerase
MHGLGNDFVIINTQDLPLETKMDKFASKISDRRLGIGCDQFITYDLKQDKAVMNIYNQDGSKAKSCGNASRCLSRLIFDDKGQRETVLDVDGRNILCHYINEKEIQVDMGEANFHSSWMPKEQELWEIAGKFAIDPKEMICVDMGNPHLVIFTRLSFQDMSIIGQLFQKPELFKDGVNVNFAGVTDDTISLKVWERGTGFTLACGSGACASYAAASKLGFVGNNAEVLFENGALKMSSKGNHILMTGPAEYVFKGEYFYG